MAMGQDGVFKAVADIAMADSASYAIVGALTLVGFTIMRAMLPVKGLSLVLAPAIFWGGLSGIYAFGMLGLSLLGHELANVVVAAAVGMSAALMAMILLLRGLDAAMRIRKPLTRALPAPEPRRVRL